MIRLWRQVLLGLVALFVVSCQKVVVPESYSKINFSGIKDLTVNAQGQVILKWDAVAPSETDGATVTYSIYSAVLPSSSLGQASPLKPSAMELDSEAQPKSVGTLMTTTSETSYTITESLESGKVYGFQVVASSGARTGDNDATYGMLYVSDYQSEYSLRIISGNYQLGQPATKFADPMTVELSKLGAAVVGETVKFALIKGAGTVTASEVKTDSTGHAAADFIAGAVGGTSEVEVSYGDVKIVFYLIASSSGENAQDSDTISELQQQIEDLKNPEIGGGTTPPIAEAVGIPSQPTSNTALAIGVISVAEYKYALVNAAITCADAGGSYSASWAPISQLINLSGLTNGTKRLCLIGKNGTVVQTNASSYTFIVDSTAPSSFAILGPAALVNSTAPTINWQASNGAINYNLKIASDGSCSTLIQTFNGVAATSKVPAPLANGTYYVCVEAINSAAVTSQASNNGYAFTIDASVPPTPAAPSAGASYIASTSATVTWSAVVDVGPAGISGYNFRVGTVAGGGDIYNGNVGNVTTRSVPGLTHGTTYFAEVQAVDAAGNTSAWSATSSSFTIDTALTTAPTAVSTAADSAAGADTRFDNDTGFYIVWSGAADNESGIRDYNLVVYQQANCAGAQTSVTGIATSNYLYTGVDGTTYSFKVVAFDNAGNFAVSACSGSMTVDTTAPPVLTNIVGAMGSLSGEIKLTITYPGVTSDYASVVLRRASGAAPPVDCSSGVVAKTLSAFVATEIIDQTLSAGNYFSYRACIYDAAGNLTSSNTVSNAQAKEYVHTVFVGRNVITGAGAFGGAIPGDAYCKAAAVAAGLSADHWKALISWGYNNAKDRMSIKGKVLRTNGTQVASSAADLWDGSIPATISYDEYGVAVVNTYVWTSSNTNGTNNGHNCSNWQSTAWTGQNPGATWETNGSWINRGGSNVQCVSSYPLFCMSQFGPNFLADTSPSGNGNIDLILDFPTDTSSYGKVEIRRLAGATSPNANCSSDGTIVATITNFTDQTIQDATGVANGFYSYRSCVYDLDLTLVDSTPISNVRAFGGFHRIFTTTAQLTGDFGGHINGDATCKSEADAAGLTADHWKALISSNYDNAKDYVSITGPIYNTASTLIASSATDLWDGTISSALNVDANGSVISGGTNYTWTGTDSTGVRNNNSCSDWQSSAPTGQYNGYIVQTNTEWMQRGSNAACTWASRLYCISQNGPYFKAETGAGTAGDVKLTLDFPAITTGYGKVEIRRLAGFTIPNADCASDGTIISTITAFNDQTITDATGSESAYFSYRACTYDGSNNLLYSTQFPGARSKGRSHKAFATRTLYTGNMGGLQGADKSCQAAAVAGGLAGDHYKAIISDGYNTPLNRLEIVGPVFGTDGMLVATSSPDLWDGTIGTIYADEYGVATAVTSVVWTGFQSNGTDNGYHCSRWNSTSWITQRTGESNYTTTYWSQGPWDRVCTSSYHIYCISQSGPLFTAKTGTVTNGDIILELDYPADTSTFGKTEIRRISGDTAPNADCSSDGSIVATVTNFTDQAITDGTGTNSGFLSYRACTYNAANQLITSSPFASVRAKGLTQTIFLTRSLYTGNFGGIAGANTACTTAATAAGLSADSWKAVISSSTANAIDSIHVKGPIFTTDGKLFAKNKADMWDGSVSVVSLDEYNTYATGTTNAVWTATDSGGTYNTYSCSDWTSTSPTSQNYGVATYGDSNWVRGGWSANCSQSLHLYCISQFNTAAQLDGFTVATGAGVNGDIDLAVDFPADTTGYGRVDIRRIEGNTAPSSNCQSGTLVSSLSSFSDTTITDAAPIAGGRYSYRACLYDSGNDLIGSNSGTANAKGTYHIIFMSTTTTNGNIGGLGGADAICQADATAGGLSGTYVAILSTSTVNARDRFDATNHPIYDTIWRTVANNEADLFDGTVAYMDRDQYGGYNGSAGAWAMWTGSIQSGYPDASACSDWTSTAGSGRYGISQSNTSWWMTYVTSACSNPAHLYCISQ